VIELAHGNLLEADADALVNTVNCVGYMGKGIALQFKQAFPDNFKTYEAACRHGDVVPGRMLVHDYGVLQRPRYIINFPTKNHWRAKSRIEDIESGLVALVQAVHDYDIRSIAVPPLGCGLGGLNWSDVRPRIEAAFAEVTNVQVYLYGPEKTPAAKAMPVRTDRPKMTTARALFVKLMDAYAVLDYRRTLLEVQKLAYFLQVAGEPLKLKYQAGKYGPYAHNLNKVLERLEGHFIRGYGDSQRKDAEIELLPGAVQAADDFIDMDSQSRVRLRQVSELIEGFETPYGMELLATVHWVATQPDVNSEPPVQDVEAAISAVHRWNARKQWLFMPEHIQTAWDHLSQLGWLGPPHAPPSDGPLLDRQVFGAVST
jgi:O-acetyl-ADP-ribose deacetylase (regulator of RNase III)